MEILDRGLTDEEAATVATWAYQPPFDLYNSSGPEVFRLPDYHPVYDHDELVAFVCFGAEARVLGQDPEVGTVDVGAGVRPDLLSQRIGTGLMPEAIEFARTHVGARRMRTAVAAFNERSLRLCESAGFKWVRTFEGPAGREFVEFVLDLDLLTTYRRGVDLYNAGDVAAYAACFTPDAQIVRPDWQAHGRAEIEAMWARELRVFPGRRLTVLAAAHEGDAVLAEWEWTCDSVRIPGMEVARFAGGLIAQYRMYWDHRQVEQQLL